MKKFMSIFNLFIFSMGIPLVLLVFYSGIFALLNINPVNLTGFYNVFRERFSIFIFSWSFFIISVLIFILLLIVFKGKNPMDAKK